ncbi:MAG: phospholipase D-like domain-containing protein [Gemmatimonadota bacterium]
MTSGAPWWLAALALFGLLAILTAVVSLFFALGRRPSRMWTENIGAVGSDDFMRPIATLLNLPLRRGGGARLLDNGDGFLPPLLADIGAAQRSINFMVYIWEPGRMSDIMFDALIERANAGVQVRVLLDGLGGIRCPDEDIDRLRAAGGQVQRFRPPRLGLLTRFHRRNHRRAIIIDGLIGYTGGAAVGDKWLGDARTEEEWRDSLVRMEGCLALHAQAAFSELWAFCTGEVLTGDSFFPPDVGEDEVSGMASCTVVSSPSSEEHPLRLFYFLTFLAARERLWITSPYFVPDRHTREVVKRRARAGVDVRILMPSEHTDATPIRRASHSYYGALMDAGVRIYEYQPTMIHAKHVVVDGQWSIVGSANMDIRSKELNEENVVGILDAPFAMQMEEAFLRDIGRAREFDRGVWRRRGFGDRLLERICVLFAEQY